MRRFTRYKTCLILGLALAFNCQANDLMSAYRMAEVSDPVYQQAIAAYKATLEAKPQARAVLLPQLNLSANTASNDQDISTGSGFGSSGEIGFNSHGYSLDLTQPIYRRARFLSLEQTDSQIDQAQAELDAALQDLMIRVAARYFDVLAAIDNLRFAEAEKKSLARQLEQANQRFEVGLTAITDVQEAQAGYDRAVANVILAENAIDNAREALLEITGEYLPALAPLGDKVPLVKPAPDSIEDWASISREQNLLVTAARYQLETARQEIDIQRSGHYPTLDLFANKGFNSAGGRFGGTQTHSTAVGIELNVPIFQGGLVNSRTREATHLYKQAQQQLEQQFRSAQRDTRESYLGVISGISQVKALKQTVKSSQTALEATLAGFEVGTRTAVDVVASERVTFQAKRDYSRARYDYILNTLRLKRAAGTLSPDDLRTINNWLE